MIQHTEIEVNRERSRSRSQRKTREFDQRQAQKRSLSKEAIQKRQKIVEAKRYNLIIRTLDRITRKDVFGAFKRIQRFSNTFSNVNLRLTFYS